MPPFARFRSALIVTIAAGALVVRPLPAQTPADSALARRVTALADRYVAAFLVIAPTSAELSGMTLARHDALDDNSLAALGRWRATEDSLWAALQGLDARSLTG